jgi:hypothetical protein
MKMKIAIYNLQRTYPSLRDDFRIGLVISLISLRVAALASPQANTATLRLITSPIRKSSRNDIFIK